ncbi:MAG: hypothetical protein SGI83_14575 [Bacteroidota bacterium]|nr:hypothetical protein [Bacteroidota bacterium]
MSNSNTKSTELTEGQKPVEKIPQPPVTKGKRTYEMMKKHLLDENDVITEEDFKNLVVAAELPTDEAHQPLIITNDENRPKDEDKDPKMITPWNVIS